MKARTAELWVIFSYTLCGMVADQEAAPLLHKER